MTIKEWIKQLGGISEASRVLGFAQATIWSWYHLERFPRPAQQEFIKERSDGRVSIENWRALYVAEKKAKEKK